MKALIWNSRDYGKLKVRPEMVVLTDHLVEEFVQMNIKNGSEFAMDVRELVVAGFHAAIFALQSDDAKEFAATLGRAPTKDDWIKWLDSQAFLKQNDSNKNFVSGRVLS